ncbi:MAG: hypothetical protein JXB04_04970 [Kiritimatiellae bacterium]|nr:hypothetical protein [Kiritimatiellia bacterium]
MKSTCRRTPWIILVLSAGLMAAAAIPAGAASPPGWRHAFHDPLPPSSSLSNVTSTLTVEGNARYERYQGAVGYVVFSNITVDITRYPALHLEVPRASSSWSLHAGPFTGPLVCVHSSSAPGTVAVDLADALGLSGEQTLEIQIRLSDALEAREMALVMPRGWTRFDDFDTRHWVSEFDVEVYTNSPHWVGAPKGWHQPFTGTYSPAQPSEGETAMRAGTPIHTDGVIAYNYCYFKTVLPEPEDWSRHDMMSFDALMEEGGMGNPECCLALKNADGEEFRVPLFIDWRLFQYESRQMAFPLLGNCEFEFPDYYTNYHVPPIPLAILSNVTEVALGFEQYMDGVLTNNFIQLDNMRLSSTQLWEGFEGPDLAWATTNYGARAGVTHNRTLDDSAGALCIAWSNLDEAVLVRPGAGPIGENWHAYSALRAGVFAPRTNTWLSWVVNDRTSAAVKVHTTGAWLRLSWPLPSGVALVSNLELRITGAATGTVYVDLLELGEVTGPVSAARGWALKDVNRLSWTLSDTSGVESLVVVYRTNAPPQNETDGTVAATPAVHADPVYVFEHAGVSDDATYYYGIFARFEDATYSAAAEDAGAAVSRRFVTVGRGDYEAAFSKENGALLYLHNTDDDTTLSAGNEGQDLWHLVFLNATTPDFRASWFGAGRANENFSYTEDPLTLSYAYADGPRRLDVSVVVDDTVTNRLSLRLTITNGLDEAIRTVNAPCRLTFATTNINYVVFPMQEGVSFTRNFFLHGRYSYQQQPWLSADFIGLDSTDGLLSLYVLQDSLYDADILPNHDPARPVVQPSNLGAGALRDGSGRSFMDYEIVTCIPTGRTWTSPLLVLETGVDSIRHSISNYTALSGFNDTDLYPTLRQKLEPFGLFDRMAHATVLAVEASMIKWMMGVEDGELWQRLRDEWLETEIPRDTILHFTHWQEEYVEDLHPDCLPTWTERYGPKSDLTNLIAEARERGWLAMPFSNWTVWNKPGVVQWDWLGSGLVPISEACTKPRGTNGTYLEYWGYMVKPWHTNVYTVHSNMMADYTTNYPMDAMFVDMTCERTWRYTRIDEDGDGVDERVFTGYTQATIDHNHFLKHFFPLFTEGVYDKMLGEVAGYCQTMRQKYFLDLIAHIGAEFDDWTIYPIAADITHENVAFYQHDLSFQLFPNTKELLTHYALMGYNHITDVASWLKRENRHGENWMYISDAFQKGLASKHFGQPLNAYDRAVGGDLRVIRMSYGSGADELTVLGNFRDGEALYTNGCSIAPGGLLAALPGHRLIAGVFTNTFNDAPLPPGDHYIVVERLTNDTISVKHPHGADTSLTILRPDEWTNGVIAVAVLRDGSEFLAGDRLTLSGSNMLLYCSSETADGSPITGFELRDAGAADVPVYFASRPVLETEGPTQVTVWAAASRPVTMIVSYGIEDGPSWTVTNSTLAFSHASLVNLPIAGTDYWFIVEIRDALGHSAVSRPLYYPAGGLAWSEDFSVRPGAVSFDLGGSVDKDLVYNEGDGDNDVFSGDAGAIHCYVENGWSDADGFPTNHLLASRDADLGFYSLMSYSNLNAIEIEAVAGTESHYIPAPLTNAYRKIGILAAAAYGDAQFTLKLHYQDSSVVTTQWEIFDWYAGSMPWERVKSVLGGMDRAEAANGTVQDANHFQVYECVVADLDATNPLVGITVGNDPFCWDDGDRSYAAIFAINGSAEGVTTNPVDWGWRDGAVEPGLHSEISVTNGHLLMTVTNGYLMTTRGKVFSPRMTVDLAEFPVLEVRIENVRAWGGGAYYRIGLLDDNPPYPEATLFSNAALHAGTMFFNIPKLTGWAGTKKISVEFDLQVTNETSHDLEISYVKLRKDLNVPWADGFDPPRPTWSNTFNAILRDEGDGTASVMDQGDPQGWGYVSSEILVMDVGEYPRAWAEVTSIQDPDLGANFKVNMNGEGASPGYATVVPLHTEPFEQSGPMQRLNTESTLDAFRFGMIVGGTNHQTSVVTRLQVMKRAPDQANLVWDAHSSSVVAGEGQTLWLPVTATDYDSDTVQYYSSHLPAGAQYDGILTWSLPSGTAGTRRIYLYADDGQALITNVLTITITNASIQLESPWWNARRLAVTSTTVEAGGTYGAASTDVVVEVSVNGGTYGTDSVSCAAGMFSWTGTVWTSPTRLDARVRDRQTAKISSAERCEVYSSVLGPSFLTTPTLETRDATSGWVLVRAATQVTVRADYGVFDAFGYTLTATNPSFTHALQASSLEAGWDHRFQVIITDPSGQSMISPELLYPARGVFWEDLFEGDTSRWRDETTDPRFNATLSIDDGLGLITVAKAPKEEPYYLKGKILSEVLTADVDQFPVLEVCVSTASLREAYYEIALQGEDDPWPRAILVDEHEQRTGTMIFNIPRLTGWTGTKTFSIELCAYNWFTNAQTFGVDHVRLRTPAATAWEDDFDPPRDTWCYQFYADLFDNGDGTARLVQDSQTNWGWILSEVLVLDADEYPWVTTYVTALDTGAQFKALMKDERHTNFVTLLSQWEPDFVDWGRMDKTGTNVLDKIRVGMSIEGRGATAVVSHVWVEKRAPGITLAWDPAQKAFKAGAGDTVYLPFTATDYAGRRVDYGHYHLPEDALYNGFLSWTVPAGEPGTRRFQLLTDNGRVRITNDLTFTLTNALIQLHEPLWLAPWVSVDSMQAVVEGWYMKESTGVVVEVSVDGAPYSTAGVTLQDHDTFLWTGAVTSSPITLQARLADPHVSTFSSSNRCEVYSALHAPSFLLPPIVERRDATSAWVVVRATTQATAVVWYGLEDPDEHAVTSATPSLTHAVLVTSLQPGQGYWFQAYATHGPGRSMISEKVFYPGDTAVWSEAFDGAPEGWELLGGSTVGAGGGHGIFTFPTGLVGKAISPEICANVNQFPILEISIAEADVYPDVYQVWLLERENYWDEIFLYEDHRPGRLILNIPHLTGWSGDKRFSVEMVLWRNGTTISTVEVERIVVRADGNAAWEEKFEPPADTWTDAVRAVLEDNYDGTATLRQDGQAPAYGHISSEMLVLELRDYPWLSADLVSVSNKDLGAVFKLNEEDRHVLTNDPVAILVESNAPASVSGSLYRFPTTSNTLDALRATMVIGGAAQTAVIERLQITKTIPGRSLRWDWTPPAIHVARGESIILPFTSVDYEGRTIAYSSQFLPDGSTYDGLLRWDVPVYGPALYQPLFVAFNGELAITSPVTIIVTNVYQAAGHFGHGSNCFTVTWGAQTGQTYRVLYKNHLMDETWSALGDDVLARDWMMVTNDFTIGTNIHRFYRIFQTE